MDWHFTSKLHSADIVKHNHVMFYSYRNYNPTNYKKEIYNPLARAALTGADLIANVAAAKAHCL